MAPFPDDESARRIAGRLEEICRGRTAAGQRLPGATGTRGQDPTPPQEGTGRRYGTDRPVLRRLGKTRRGGQMATGTGPARQHGLAKDLMPLYTSHFCSGDRDSMNASSGWPDRVEPEREERGAMAATLTWRFLRLHCHITSSRLLQESHQYIKLCHGRETAVNRGNSCKILIKARKRLWRTDGTQSIAIHGFVAIFVAVNLLVRDREAGGSNPLAPI